VTKPLNGGPRLPQEADRGRVELNSAECKGCGLCVEACPPKVLCLADYLNPYGYHPATCFIGGCTGCGICFFVCPEPGAVTVLRAAGQAWELTEAVA
jgi:2-oxoglutarate ferredoxin oxidoreductase subunit delta